jgi:predicted MPP superfamily phosphohydrolase
MLGFWFILTAIVAFNLAWWHWADRRLRPIRFAAAWRSLLALFIICQIAYLAAFVIAPQWARRSHEVLPGDLLRMIYLWSVLVLPVTGLVTLLVTAGAGIVRAVRRRRNVPAGEPRIESAASDRPPLTRRQLLAAAAVALPPLVTAVGVAYGRRSLYDLHVSHVDVPIAGLPEDLVGVKIAHITDVHVGKFVRESYLRQAAEMANQLNADVHLLTGDLIDLSINDLPLALDFVSWLKPAHELAMCEGNHDLLDDARTFYAETTRRGIPILANDGKTIRLPGRTPIRLLGLKWGTPGVRGADEEGYAGMLKGMWKPGDGASEPLDRAGSLPILLAHHPHAFDAAAAAGIPLTLSGHTHGGLLMLSQTVGPGAVLYRYWSGLYRKPNAALYVSNGIGSWFPLRTAARPEIACLTLRRA